MDSKTWNLNSNGFWKATPHLCLSSNYWYKEEKVHLHQNIVIDDQEDIQTYHIWDKTYIIEEISSILSNVGFKQFEYFSDVTGKEYEDETEILTVIAKK